MEGAYLMWGALVVFALPTGLGLLTPANRYLLGSGEYLMDAKHAAIDERLEKQPGEHLVLVSYGPRHQIYEELVYNRADIDGSKVVWARSLGAEKDAELIRHYPNRDVWMLDEDAGVTLERAAIVPAHVDEVKIVGLGARNGGVGSARCRDAAKRMPWRAVALAIGVILCAFRCCSGLEGRTFLGRPLGGDFVEFYTIGKILNTAAPARIYDLWLRHRSAARRASRACPTIADAGVWAGAIHRVAVSAVRAAAVCMGVCGVAGFLGGPLSWPHWRCCSAPWV